MNKEGVGVVHKIVTSKKNCRWFSQMIMEQYWIKTKHNMLSDQLKMLLKVGIELLKVN